MLRSGFASLCVVFMSAGAGCASSLPVYPDLVLDQSTVRMEGWFSARGEWMLFTSRNFDDYNPYVDDEHKRCVSVVNDTGLQRPEFFPLDRKQVVVRGHAVKYKELEDGKSLQDRYLPKKSFKDETVLNFCLREWVFVATSIKEKKDD